MQRWASRLLLYAGFGSAVSILFSIALSQALLGVALLALLAGRLPVRFPPILLALGLFFAQTAMSLLFSGHIIAGWPQIRKFFVFATLLVLASSLRSIREVRLLCICWSGIAVLSAGAAFLQYVRRDQAAHVIGATNDYDFYLDSRLHGLASHWMTFGGELMIVFVLSLAFALFAVGTKWRWWFLCCLPVIGISLVLGLSRSVFLIGLPAGSVYLLWVRKRALVMLLPIVGALLWWSAPFQVRERISSVARPHASFDSNGRRVILIRTGLAMIKRHPFFGVGPEQVGAQFMEYVPADVARPLPKGWYGHLHNIYLQYAAERGIPALLLLLWLIGRILYDLHRSVSSSAPYGERWFIHGAIAAIYSILAEGLFEHDLGDSEVLTMFLTIVACAYVVKWERAAAAQPEISQLSVSVSMPQCEVVQ
ncbi:MAG TPA: O-antigen ligase family protein [Bryobacteraceae bacterium]|jgi:hypothetical protein|nr:O-antigen ligase family protein [Bryobacteraceae bacterium]